MFTNQSYQTLQNRPFPRNSGATAPVQAMDIDPYHHNRHDEIKNRLTPYFASNGYHNEDAIDHFTNTVLDKAEIIAYNDKIPESFSKTARDTQEIFKKIKDGDRLSSYQSTCLNMLIMIFIRHNNYVTDTPAREDHESTIERSMKPYRKIKNERAVTENKLGDFFDAVNIHKSIDETEYLQLAEFGKIWTQIFLDFTPKTTSTDVKDNLTVHELLEKYIEDMDFDIIINDLTKHEERLKNHHKYIDLRGIIHSFGQPLVKNNHSLNKHFIERVSNWHEKSKTVNVHQLLQFYFEIHFNEENPRELFLAILGICENEKTNNTNSLLVLASFCNFIEKKEALLKHDSGKNLQDKNKPKSQLTSKSILLEKISKLKADIAICAPSILRTNDFVMKFFLYSNLIINPFYQFNADDSNTFRGQIREAYTKKRLLSKNIFPNNPDGTNMIGQDGTVIRERQKLLGSELVKNMLAHCFLPFQENPSYEANAIIQQGDFPHKQAVTFKGSNYRTDKSPTKYGLNVLNIMRLIGAFDSLGKDRPTFEHSLFEGRIRNSSGTVKVGKILKEIGIADPAIPLNSIYPLALAIYDELERKNLLIAKDRETSRLFDRFDFDSDGYWIDIRPTDPSDTNPSDTNNRKCYLSHRAAKQARAELVKRSGYTTDNLKIMKDFTITKYKGNKLKGKRQYYYGIKLIEASPFALAKNKNKTITETVISKNFLVKLVGTLVLSFSKKMIDNMKSFDMSKAEESKAKLDREYLACFARSKILSVSDDLNGGVDYKVADNVFLQLSRRYVMDKLIKDTAMHLCKMEPSKLDTLIFPEEAITQKIKFGKPIKNLFAFEVAILCKRHAFDIEKGDTLIALTRKSNSEPILYRQIDCGNNTHTVDKYDFTNQIAYTNPESLRENHPYTKERGSNNIASTVIGCKMVKSIFTALCEHYNISFADNEHYPNIENRPVYLSPTNTENKHLITIIKLKIVKDDDSRYDSILGITSKSQIYREIEKQDQIISRKEIHETKDRFVGNLMLTYKFVQENISPSYGTTYKEITKALIKNAPKTNLLRNLVKFVRPDSNGFSLTGTVETDGEPIFKMVAGDVHEERKFKIQCSEQEKEIVLTIAEAIKGKLYTNPVEVLKAMSIFIRGCPLANKIQPTIIPHASVAERDFRKSISVTLDDGQKVKCIPPQGYNAEHTVDKDRWPVHPEIVNALEEKVVDALQNGGSSFEKPVIYVDYPGSLTDGERAACIQGSLAQLKYYHNMMLHRSAATSGGQSFIATPQGLAPSESFMDAVSTSKATKSSHVVLCMDQTGSMGSLISAAQSTLESLISKLSSSRHARNSHVAFVGYRDFGDGEEMIKIMPTKNLHRNEQVNEIKQFISEQYASGGADLAEDVLHGFAQSAVLLKPVREDLRQAFVWCADAIGHGMGEMSDSHQQENTLSIKQADGTTMKASVYDIAHAMGKAGVDFQLLQVNVGWFGPFKCVEKLRAAYNTGVYQRPITTHKGKFAYKAFTPELLLEKIPGTDRRGLIPHYEKFSADYVKAMMAEAPDFIPVVDQAINGQHSGVVVRTELQSIEPLIELLKHLKKLRNDGSQPPYVQIVAYTTDKSVLTEAQQLVEGNSDLLAVEDGNELEDFSSLTTSMNQALSNQQPIEEQMEVIIA